MKVIVMSRTSLDVTQYNNVTGITKIGSTITLTISGGTTVSVDTTTKAVYIMES